MTEVESVVVQWDEFEQLNKELHKNINLMAHYKEKLLSKHKGDAEKAKKEIDELYGKTCKIFAYLKALHQKSLIRRETAQSEFNNLSKSVDEESLGVKNFEYEERDTMKQIAICDEYNSHKNEPKLISKKEFYKRNPQEKIEDIHQEKTMRLQYELQERKELQKSLREITQNVKTLSNELTEKEQFLKNLQSQIGNVFEAIKPLQKYMNLPSVMMYPNESEIDCLPSALFAIYQSFTTQIHCDHTLDQHIKITMAKRTNDDVVIIKKRKKSVLGKRKFEDIKHNESGCESMKTEKNKNISDECDIHDHLEDGEIGNTPQEPGPPRKKLRTSNRSKDKKDKKTSSKKHRKSVTKTISIAIEKKCAIENNDCQETLHNIMSADMDGLLDAMKLNVEFKAIGIELEFMYCTKYNLVLIAIKRYMDNAWKYENATIFMELFDGHSMIELPEGLNNEHRLLENGASVAYFAAFSWAQELSGCYIFGANANANTDKRKRKKRDIVDLNALQFALKWRKQNMISLRKQIKELSTLSSSNSKDKYNGFIKNLLDCAFGTQDKDKNKQRQNLAPPMNKLLLFKLISDQSKINREHSVDKYKKYFELILQRKAFSLHCLIEIGASYPNRAPLFFVEDISSHKVKRTSSDYFVNECKNIEIQLNADFNYVNETNKHLLLSMMIYKLQIYFDIYVMSKMSSESNNSPCLDHTVRIHRGRDRRQQFGI